jgi:hypothetical protein
LLSSHNLLCTPISFSIHYYERQRKQRIVDVLGLMESPFYNSYNSSKEQISLHSDKVKLREVNNLCRVTQLRRVRAIIDVGSFDVTLRSKV